MKKLIPVFAALSLVTAIGVVWIFGAPVAPTVQAADYPDASPWVETGYARIRLVSGGTQNDGKRWLGVQITLDPKWKTYWRNPGHSGVPPRFNWSQSTNFSKARVVWPAPEYLRDDYGIAYGYYDQVVFPVEITPKSSSEDIAVKLTINYAVCKDICIPELSELALVLPAIENTTDENRENLQDLITKYIDRAPKIQSASSELRIETTNIEMNADKPVLAITAALGASPASAELFVEGPQDYFFRVPDTFEDLGDGRGRFIVAIDGAKTIDDLAGFRIGSTLVTADSATEYWWTVQ